MVKGSRDGKHGKASKSSKKTVGQQTRLDASGRREKKQKQAATGVTSDTDQDESAVRMVISDASTPQTDDPEKLRVKLVYLRNYIELDSKT